MPLDEFAGAAERGTLPAGAVALTFDDGYRDNLENAVPALVELGLPATFFLTTQALEGGTEYWWDALERALLIAKTVPKTLTVTVDGQRLELPTSTNSERRAAHGLLHPLLVRATLDERDARLAEVLQWADVPLRSSSAPILTAHEVQQLARMPRCSIGTHTVHHLALGAQTAKVVADELGQSCRALAALIGRPVTSLAYPYGDFSPGVVASARAEGLSVAVTCEAQSVRTLDDSLRIPRVEVTSRSVADLRARLMSL
jgi:peptidoglycan/xylan/chitin deacetylase (PgdA/CDA1 family)